MIIKSFEIVKISKNKQKIILIYGKNEGLKKEIFNNLMIDQGDLSYYEEKEILDNPDNFVNNLLNRSLFANQRTFIIKRSTDKIYKFVKEITSREIIDQIIIDTDNLDRKSKLRSFFEKDKELVCIPVYPDDHKTLSKIAFNFFKEKRIQISNSNLNQIINKSLGDRENLFNELIKIENYSKNGKKLTNEVINKLVLLSENHSISELIDNCLAKNNAKLIEILNENIYSNEDYINILRTLLNKSKKILNLSLKYNKNKNIDQTISESKPPIFWKDKEITKCQIKNWEPNKLRILIYKINELELIVKKNINNSLNLIIDFLLEQSIKTNN